MSSPVQSDVVPPELEPTDPFEIFSMCVIFAVSSVVILFVVKPYDLPIPFLKPRRYLTLDFGSAPPIGILVLLLTTTIDFGNRKPQIFI